MSPKIFFASSGLGNDRRGFEAHTEDLFVELKKEHTLNVYLFKGGGPKKNKETAIFNLYRKHRPARTIGLLVGRNPYVIQNISFFIGLLPKIFFHKPAVIYLGEPVLYNYLFGLRGRFNLKFIMIFFTGGNSLPPRISSNDYFQLVTPLLLPLTAQRQIPSSKVKVIPHFLRSSDDPILFTGNKKSIRRELGLPEDRLIILSVGAIDRSVKRMDYLIDEVSKLNASFFLVILGEFEKETQEVIAFAENRLPEKNFLIKRMDRGQLWKYYRSADLFVLASLQEGFGIVQIEALLAGLPVLAHDYPVSRYVLEEHGFYGDFLHSGNLAKLIDQVGKNISDERDIVDRRAYVQRKFSWGMLRQRYLQMFNETLNSK